MDHEMRFHIDMEAERLEREHGLEAGEARRQAFVAFGGLEKFKDEGRRTRGLHWMDVIALDMRLAVRILVKHRGLTIAGGFAMAVAIGIGATFFAILTEVLLAGIVARVAGQLAAGVVGGSLLSGGVFAATGMSAGAAAAMLAVVAATMTLVVLLSAAGPARQSLRIQPVDALRIDG
jgi:hypothetical protein